MSDYFGLHDVYEFLRKFGVPLILPKLICPCSPGISKPTSRRNLTEISRPRAVVTIVILIRVTERLGRKRIRNVIGGFTDLSLDLEIETPATGSSSFSV